MRKNLNVNKIVNEMDYLLYLIMKQEWEKNKDYYLEVLSEKGKTYQCFYFDIGQRYYSSFSWSRKELMFFIERYNSVEVNKAKLTKKINNAISYFRFPECKHYKMIVEIELLKSICEVERI